MYRPVTFSIHVHVVDITKCTGSYLSQLYVCYSRFVLKVSFFRGFDIYPAKTLSEQSRGGGGQDHGEEKPFFVCWNFLKILSCEQNSL